MNRDYILNETRKIFQSDLGDIVKKSAYASSWVLANFKSVNLKIFDLDNTNPLADFFVIGSVQNKTQAQSVANTLERVFKDNGIQVKSIEGLDEAEWILVDTGDIIVHIFQEVFRDIYDLDSLWKDYGQIQIPNEYYFSNEVVPETNDASSFKNYF